MNRQRPVNLDLTSLKYPPMAIASILHRVSGVILFILFPALLYFLSWSLHSEAAFQEVKAWLANPFCKLLFWAFSAAAAYHLLAGTRHLIMDIGFGEELKAGRMSAVFVIVLALVLAIFLGIWIW
ncbi:succinate dehydrogenase, cytochrome b556 subunit [Legionella londiniensis]|uniref:Succinate dehydrogenase cytochrome b556 subunit n=1 Tax=Legionella londiniensis TaxID=45068 RepID=A0A0W0VSK3_9GAMM|nr:succinate dehydrogenase, cytochrome b556 subunit [Legionella londiniensis]KTD23034.1 succinate dehydrogenase cytochrome b556 subunit C [Legionella londiniensis]STX94051.1 succinate dehydrogenase cytochrome b556 subunit C [Legionella londiniensis]